MKERGVIRMPGWTDEERLYKDLLYTTSLYQVGEQVYPYWEILYAIVVGALLTVFFAGDRDVFESLLLCAVGLILTINWRRLVSRNRGYADARETRMMDLAAALQKSVDLSKVMSPNHQVKDFRAFEVFEDQRRHFPGPDPKKNVPAREYVSRLHMHEHLSYPMTYWNGKSTWEFRLAVPSYLAWIWGAIAVYALAKNPGQLENVPYALKHAFCAEYLIWFAGTMMLLTILRYGLLSWHGKVSASGHPPTQRQFKGLTWLMWHSKWLWVPLAFWIWYRFLVSLFEAQ